MRVSANSAPFSRNTWMYADSAVARAGDPAAMAEAMAGAVRAGREAYLADPMERTDMALPSTPVIGKAFL